MKKLSVFLLSLLVVANAHAGVIFQAFYWDAPSDGQNQWWNRLSQQSHELSKSGFSAIWLPPALKCASGGYSVGYDPFDDYDLGSKDQRGSIPTHWGTKTSLVNAVATFRANGLDVYLDMVLAHRGGDDGNKNFYYLNARGDALTGRFAKSANDFTTQDSMFGRQINHYSPYMRKGLIEAGQWQAETLGTQGMRFDHVKGVPADFLGEYLTTGSLQNQFAFVEYWDEDPFVLSNYLSHGLFGRASVLDFPLWGKLKAMANAKGFFNLRELVHAGYVARDARSAVTFVENHDTDRSFPTVSNKTLSYAFILTSEGYPTVFWKDYYDYGLKPAIDTLLWIHNILASGSTIYRWADDDFLVYERQGGPKLLVGLNDNMVASRREWVATSFGPKVKLVDYSGGHGEIETNDQGWAYLEVKPNSYAAYAPKGIVSSMVKTMHYTTQVFRGSDDLDIPAANSDTFTPVETLRILGGTNLKWWVDLETNDRAFVEVRAVTASGETRSLFRGTVSQKSASGSLGIHQTDVYRLEILVGTGKPVSTPFKFTVNYLAPQQ